MKVFADLDHELPSSQRWDERWAGPDDGLIAAWHAGRAMASARPDQAARAVAGQLIELPWKGGVPELTKQKRRWGTLHYLAMWTGIRGDPLDIDTAQEVTLTCSATGVHVTFTMNRMRWAGVL